MRTLLVAMPWHSLEYPSLALGVLKKKATIVLPHITVDTLHASFPWAEFVLSRRADVRWVESYATLADTVFEGIGDWIFSGALNEQPSWKLDEAKARFANSKLDWELLEQLHHWAPEFIDGLAERITAAQYDLIGFTTTFMQNAASLALAVQLKRLRPETHIAFGGANCDGVQGPALHRNYGCIDFVVSGEGERAFVDLLRALEGDLPLSEVAGLAWRDADGQRINPDGGLLPIGELVEPDFDEYFAALEKSPLQALLQPSLVLESARGCWWGEKQHCTFCGLNGSSIKFRSKSPEAVWAEILNLTTRHHILDVMMVDNIMDTRYMQTLLPHITESGLDLRLHYEVKSNLGPSDLATLKHAHIEQIQPGIESLNSNVLKLMRKGVTAAQNVALLREARNENVSVAWNYLYGFPGEDDIDYDAVIAQIPALYHLQPPAGAIRLALERFSPFFNAPDLGFHERSPAGFYELIYRQSGSELADMVFLFDSPNAGVRGDVEARLRNAIEKWRQRYDESNLTLHRDGDRTVLLDSRADHAPQQFVFEGSGYSLAYELLARGSTKQTILQALSKEHIDIDRVSFDAWWEWLALNGLVFVDADRYVAIATRFDASNIKLRGAA